MSSSAMPDAVAEVRKIGTITAECHSSLDLFIESTNAVVVCM